MQKIRNRPILNENLNHGDLKNFVSEVFGIDRYTSKMGDDSDVLVLSFHVQDKLPAVDLMEFIERGYPFILDADMSAGEEEDGKYHVFVEVERTPKIAHQLTHLIKGVSQLCDHYSWKFRYFKDPQIFEFTEEKISETVPYSPAAYRSRLLEAKSKDLKEFFNQGGTDVEIESDNIITFRRPFSGDLKAKFISIGDYDKVKETVPGAIDLSESSQSEVIFLNKFLGNYDINKIGNKFLIRNGTQAVVIEKDRW
jgi:hypothetical protein